jgi:hypothetical protein
MNLNAQSWEFYNKKSDEFLRGCIYSIGELWQEEIFKTIKSSSKTLTTDTTFYDSFDKELLDAMGLNIYPS